MPAERHGAADCVSPSERLVCTPPATIARQSIAKLAEATPVRCAFRALFGARFGERLGAVERARRTDRGHAAGMSRRRERVAGDRHGPRTRDALAPHRQRFTRVTRKPKFANAPSMGGCARPVELVNDTALGGVAQCADAPSRTRACGNERSHFAFVARPSVQMPTRSSMTHLLKLKSLGGDDGSDPDVAHAVGGLAPARMDDMRAPCSEADARGRVGRYRRLFPQPSPVAVHVDYTQACRLMGDMVAMHVLHRQGSRHVSGFAVSRKYSADALPVP